jgi:ABC-type glycerol-3-phosphate transport system substrate-binding protein
MTRISRRAKVTGVAAGTGVVGLGRLEGILAHAQAPAYPKGTRLHLLQWSHFVQAADVLFAKQTAEFDKQAGIEIRVERINQNDIQARVTAAIQSGTGADIIIMANNHAHLYESALVDVSDVAEAIGAQQGGWYDYAKVNLRELALDRCPAVHHLVGDHLPGGLVPGGGPPVPRDLGRVPRRRPGAEGQGEALRAGVRPPH